jgi:hypothetical protein
MTLDKAEENIGWRLASRFKLRCTASWELELEPSSSSRPSSQTVFRPHVELTMAPHVGFDTDQIKDKARKDLLYLLEGVSKEPPSNEPFKAPTYVSVCTGSREEESGS